MQQFVSIQGRGGSGLNKINSDLHLKGKTADSGCDSRIYPPLLCGDVPF